MSKPTFWEWFDDVTATAKASPIGKVIIASNPAWHVQHTGGGCLAWALDTDDGQAEIWICDLGNGLGDSVDETYLIGLHPKDDWRDNFGDECATLADALALVPAIQGARAFALGFKADAPMTLQEFSATARYVPDLAVLNQEFYGPGFIYAETCCISRSDDGRLHLLIGNQEWCGDSSDLAMLEKRLWHWRVSENCRVA